jgi:hypothetical protein
MSKEIIYIQFYLLWDFVRLMAIFKKASYIVDYRKGDYHENSKPLKNKTLFNESRKTIIAQFLKVVILPCSRGSTKRPCF